MSRFLTSLSAVALAVAVAGCGSSHILSSGPGGSALGKITPPAFIPGPLNGERTPRARALRRPLAIMVENYAPDARPQTGLGAASLVFETLAEGGVTRFMAVYLEHGASRVGPVRSTRMYFDYWASALHAILTHVGGNDDAQAFLWKDRDVFSVDENKWEINLQQTGTPLFWRSADRVPPHNMYTNTAKLWTYAQRHHQDWTYRNASYPHKNPAPLKQRGHATSIDITFEDPLNPVPVSAYEVHYTYHRATNTYTRFMGGAPHVDAATGKTLAPANVIIMKVGTPVADPAAGPTPESILIPVIGSGQALVFQDGKVIKGTWHMANRFAPLRFLNAHGRQIPLNPGQTWIEAVPPSSPLSWSVQH